MEEDSEVKIKIKEAMDDEEKEIQDNREVTNKIEEECEGINKIKEDSDREKGIEVACESEKKTEDEKIETKENNEGDNKTEDNGEGGSRKEGECYVKIEIDEYLDKKYKMVGQKYFEDYLLFLGRGFLMRKAALSLHSEVWLTKNEGQYTFSFDSVLASYDVIFIPGEECDEVRPDGKAKSVITFEGNKMIHLQTDERGRVSKHVREFSHDKMTTTTTAVGLDKTVLRYYELVQ